MKIAIVDDSEIIRQYIVEMLSEICGLEICGEYDTAADAIAGINRNPPEAILLDIKLRSGNGLQVMRHVHKTFPDMRVIVFSNHADENTRELFQKAGAHYFFDKSHEIAQLKSTLQSMLAL